MTKQELMLEAWIQNVDYYGMLDIAKKNNVCIFDYPIGMEFALFGMEKI